MHDRWRRYMDIGSEQYNAIIIFYSFHFPFIFDSSRKPGDYPYIHIERDILVKADDRYPESIAGNGIYK